VRRPLWLGCYVREAVRAGGARSARTPSLSDSADSDSNPRETAPPRCSSSPPTCPPPSSPTSPSPWPGNAPPQATGPTTPPKSAAEHPAEGGIPTVANDLTSPDTITAERKRKAIQTVGEYAVATVDHSGASTPMTRCARYQMRSGAVPFGNCIDPRMLRPAVKRVPFASNARWLCVSTDPTRRAYLR
jgi:hypothetical protein